MIELFSKTPECGDIFRNHAAEKRKILEVFEHQRPVVTTK
jgi:hypothetical protein